MYRCINLTDTSDFFAGSPKSACYNPPGEVKFSMLKNITKILGGDPIRRVIDQHRELVDQVNEWEPKLQALDDDSLRARTGEFRARLAAGESLDELMPEVFAVVREASVRTIGLRHFDVQLIGGAVLHSGKIAEMRTGEGKTLVATLPMVLNALDGKGVHLVTVNDYLARRDARWMGPIFQFLGLRVGVLQEAARTENGRKAFVFDPERTSSQEDSHLLRLVDRREAYAADITYGTNNEFGFDYLRDNMAQSLEARSQREHHYAILDEVDNILIDEARTPLIISGPAQEDPEMYIQMARVVKQLRPEDFEVSERDRTVALTEAGEDRVEQLLGTPLRDPDRPEDLTPEQARMLGHLEQAMRAEHLFKRNKEYVVQGGRVIIVDEFTGRMMAGRRWSDGLHQAVEAKEGVRVRQENVTYATITLQNYFRKYAKLAGMTGTAMTEAEEFNKIYKVDVESLPTNLEYLAVQPDSDLVETEYSEDGHKYGCFVRPDDPERRPVYWRRKDYPDAVYRTEESKLRAITTDILSRHVLGQPMLVGTTSVELSERLSARLRAEPLQRLTMAMILRDAYLEREGIPDEGLRVDALTPLYESLDSLGQATLRQFARDLELVLNPAKPENLQRLGKILELDGEAQARLGEVLQSGIPHDVLNAKQHDRESQIIAGAGALGAVTIATNMAGRGVDIKLGGEVPEAVLASVNRVLQRAGVYDPYDLSLDERLRRLEGVESETIGIYAEDVRAFREHMQRSLRVRELGGLHVIGCQRHEARRIDNQLRGRAARQGDPGSSQFYLSLEDELMRLFGGGQVSAIMQRLNIDDAVPIAHGIVDRSIEQSQTRVEGANFDTRKHLLEYDDVLNQQREIFYSQRNRIFLKDDLSDDIAEMLEAEVARRVEAALGEPDGAWKLLAWLEEMQPTIDLEGPAPTPSFMLRLLVDDMADTSTGEQVIARLLEIARGSLEAQRERQLTLASELAERSEQHAKEQSRQKLEVVETWLEGAFLEAEEGGRTPDLRALARGLEEATGLRLELEDLVDDPRNPDLGRLRKDLPVQVETEMAARAWVIAIQALERRVGEPLSLPAQPAAPIDWDEAEAILAQALETYWAARAESVLGEIRSDMEPLRGQAGPVPEAIKVRALVRASYGQRSYFDRKTHQRRSAVVARLSYTLYAARLIEGLESAALGERVLEHLTSALGTIRSLVGRGELHRIAGARYQDLEERVRSWLALTLQADVAREAEAAETLGQAPAHVRLAMADAFGRWLLNQAHRRVFLSVGDRLWVEYLTEVEALRTAIGLEAYGQRDPLVQYKSRAFDMFQNLLGSIRAGLVSGLFRVVQSAPRAAAPAPAPAATALPPAAAPADQSDTDGAAEANGASGKKRRRRRR